MTKRLTILTMFVLLGAFGCAPAQDNTMATGETDGELATVHFSLESIAQGLDLNNKTFRLRIYSAAPASPDSETLFDSLASYGCLQASGSDISIRDLKVGDGRLVFFEVFSDSSCMDRYAMGVRGGVNIVKETELQKSARGTECSADEVCQELVHPDARCDCDKEVDESNNALTYCKAGVTGSCTVSAPIYIPLYETGKFEELPFPSQDLRNRASQTSCDVDADCNVVHPAAVCNSVLGFCTVEGLFPLSPSRPRAFHQSVTLSDGRILFLGGFNRVDDGNNFQAAAPFSELYNPITNLFEKPSAQSSFGGKHAAFAGAARIQNDSAVVAGGITEAKLRYDLGDELMMSVEIPLEYTDDCSSGTCTNFSRSLYVMDLISGTVQESTLPSYVMAHRLAVVNQGTDPYLLLTGGLVYDDEVKTVAPTNLYTECSVLDILAGDAAVCTEMTDSPMSTTRYSQADICLVQSGPMEPCDEYMTLGGAPADEATATVFSSEQEPFNQSFEFSKLSDLQGALFPEMAKVEDSTDQPARFYSFGGIHDLTSTQSNGSLMVSIGAPDVPPQQITVNLSSGQMNPLPVDLSKLDTPDSVYRLFHSVSVLEDGRVIVAGGIGSDSLPTRDVLVFEDPQTGTLEFVKKLTLRRARFVHPATVIKKGLLKGAILIVGGFTVDNEDGAVRFAEGAEIFIP